MNFNNFGNFVWYVWIYTHHSYCAHNTSMYRYTSIIHEICVFIKKTQPWETFYIFLLMEGVCVYERGDQGFRSSWFRKLTLGWMGYGKFVILDGYGS